MMTIEKVVHTPGPWKVSHSGYANPPFVIFAGSKAPNYSSQFPLSGVHAIAETFHDEGPDHEQQDADARLIAAAPELAEALMATYHDPRTTMGRAQELEAILKKAGLL